MSDRQPKVTVLISTYNRPQYLGLTIKSVIDQEFENWELIVVNDGGPDVREIVEGFGDSRIRYFHRTKNRGKASCINLGLRKAKGEYIAYIDDDDIWYPNHLRLLSAALDENPEAGVAYSDLYGVSCIKDEATGKRYALDKKIHVTRDFNRDFMFFYNHVLHVSVMHRKEAAFRVGLYDESVKVLIEWSLNRKLCYIYDFIHVPVVTGEYYMPVFKSDRISVVQRKNKKDYKHNTRKIRTALPPEPWPKIVKVDFLCPVARWDETIADRVCEIIDHIDHPIRILLINLQEGQTSPQCYQALGRVAEFDNVKVLNPGRKMPDLAAYRYAAAKSNADYVFLVTRLAQFSKIQKRIFAGLQFLRESECEAVKWDVEEEKKSPFDMLISRELFLERSGLDSENTSLDVRAIPGIAPSTFEFDAHYHVAKRALSQNQPEEAYESIVRAVNVGQGAPGIQFLVHYMVKICLQTGEFDRVEKEIRDLLDRGFVPDNLIRLGQVLQATGRYQDAAEAYQKSLKYFDVSDEDLSGPVFPFNFPKELSTFTALMGLAECHEKLGDSSEAMRMFHRASKLRANSHRPFLGFARHFLASGQIDKAEAALSRLGERSGKSDPETHRLLGKLCYKKGRPDLAFNCYRNAFENGRPDEKNIDPLYTMGRTLNRWEEVRTTLEGFLEKKPNSILALCRLADVYFNLKMMDEALQTIDRGQALDEKNAVLKGISLKIEKAMAAGCPVEPEPAKLEPQVLDAVGFQPIRY